MLPIEARMGAYAKRQLQGRSVQPIIHRELIEPRTRYMREPRNLKAKGKRKYELM